jgi:tRNA(adenine34) deaminase
VINSKREIKMNNDIHYMEQALELARYAEQQGEVPVGAIVVFQNEIIGKGWNQPITNSDPTAHAEIIAMRDAAKKMGNYRLIDCDLYVTLEPCAMCAGAMVHARIKRLIYGTPDPRSGAAGSVFNLTNSQQLNHRIIVEQSALTDFCRDILQAFFAKKR